MFYPPQLPSPAASSGKKFLAEIPDVDRRPAIIPVEFDADRQAWTIPVHQLGSIVIRAEADSADESISSSPPSAPRPGDTTRNECLLAAIEAGAGYRLTRVTTAPLPSSPRSMVASTRVAD
jgi:hypothetical protein